MLLSIAIYQTRILSTVAFNLLITVLALLKYLLLINNLYDTIHSAFANYTLSAWQYEIACQFSLLTEVFHCVYYGGMSASFLCQSVKATLKCNILNIFKHMLLLLSLIVFILAIINHSIYLQQPRIIGIFVEIKLIIESPSHFKRKGTLK